MLLDKIRHLRFLGAVDAFDQRDTEVAVVDTPDLHAAVGVTRARIVYALDQGAALDLDMKPGPLFDAVFFYRVGNVINLLEIRHCVLQPNR